MRIVRPLSAERAGHRLADPPGRVRRELEAPAPVELLDGADEAERALLDQVEEGEAAAAVALGDRDDEPEVRLDHLLLGVLVAGLDALGEVDLVCGGEQRDPADVLEEELQRVGGLLSTCVAAARRGRSAASVASAARASASACSSSSMPFSSSWRYSASAAGASRPDPSSASATASMPRKPLS